MQANYRAIFIEMLNAQAAATAAIVDVGVRCAELMRQECQAALLTLVKETRLGNGACWTPRSQAANPGPLPSSRQGWQIFVVPLPACRGFR